MNAKKITSVIREVKNMKNAVIVSAVRTAVGSFGGSLKDISAAKLGMIVIKEAVQRAGISPADVDEVYMGNVVQAGKMWPGRRR